jgi:hypothetical protein
MIEFNARNLAPTATGTGRMRKQGKLAPPRRRNPRTRPCEVGHPVQPHGWDPVETWAYYHRWPGHDGGMDGAACINCGKTRKELRYWVYADSDEEEAPTRGPSRLARAIATTAADVPPIV